MKIQGLQGLFQFLGRGGHHRCVEGALHREADRFGPLGGQGGGGLGGGPFLTGS